MNISYEGIGYLAVTMRTDGCKVGQVCTLDAVGRAVPCTSGSMFCGVVNAVDGGKASVQLEGFVEVAYSGTEPACGLITLSANGTGGVVVNSNGRVYLVVAVDAAAKKLMMKL